MLSRCPGTTSCPPTTRRRLPSCNVPLRGWPEAAACTSIGTSLNEALGGDCVDGPGACETATVTNAHAAHSLAVISVRRGIRQYRDATPFSSSSVERYDLSTRRGSPMAHRGGW